MESKAKLGALQHQAGGTEVHRGLWAEFCREGLGGALRLEAEWAAQGPSSCSTKQGWG